MKNARSQGEVRPEPQSAEGLQPVSLLAYKTFRTAGDAAWLLTAAVIAPELASQAMSTEKTNGKSTPPAVTSFSPTPSGASSLRKYSPIGSPLTIVPSVL